MEANLTIIDMRLKVFPQYLEYRITARLLDIHAEEIGGFVYRLKQIGQFKPERLQSFNEWLFYNNYSNLIL